MWPHAIYFILGHCKSCDLVREQLVQFQSALFQPALTTVAASLGSQITAMLFIKNDHYEAPLYQNQIVTIIKSILDAIAMMNNDD